jgi:hypothetical protein
MERERPQAAVDKARAAFQAAEQEHAKRVAAIEAEADRRHGLGACAVLDSAWLSRHSLKRNAVGDAPF